MDLTQLIDPQCAEACSPFKVASVKEALKQGIIHADDHPLALFYNMSRFKRHIEDVQAALPSDIFLHTMAVNPVLSLMKYAAELGLGFEAASLGELTQSLNTGIHPSKIVFDSPVKSLPELKFAFEKGVAVNADNFQELDRVTKLISENNYSNVRFGLRINPQVGVGSIKEMSTSGKVSKFGIAWGDYADEVFNAYKQRPWMNGIHVHIGSQGIPIDMNIDGIRKIVDIVNQINENAGKQQITFIDIGGGLPVNFNDENNTSTMVPSIFDYAQKLKQKVPELFSGKFQVLTEYGRIYNAKPGFFVSKVEYNKLSGGRPIALVHLGADLLVRTVWAPNAWALRITVLTPSGDIKLSEKRVKQDIAGPCCHAGDVVAHERELPLLEAGDWIVVHDTGGYFYSAYSYFNSRQAPPIYGFDEGPNDTIVNLRLLKKGQSPEETMAFFS